VKKVLAFLLITFIAISLTAGTALSLTLEEAISLAKENLPSYRASMIKIKSSEALYIASLSPYLPSLDASAAYRKHYTSMNEHDSRTYNLTLSYTLFDGGRRKADRNIARLNLDTDKEELNRTLMDLQFNVKAAFYTAIAQRDILHQRKVQLQYAQKDYEVADGRYRLGAARLSDVLHSSVRLQQAKFNLVQAEGELKTAIAELNSLIGRPLDTQFDIQGSLDMDIQMPDRNKILTAALQRPEIKQAENLIKITENNRSLAMSAFYPVLSLEASYIKREMGNVRTFSPEEKIAGITATWNIFELGKFFRKRSSELEIDVSRARFDELKRQLSLEVHKAYNDFITAANKLNVARQQLRQAEHNYEQAFGEYRVGRADILSLVHAERQLSDAREQLIASKLNLILSKAIIERAAGIESLEEL
jgi:outer membrane protein TolC